MRSKQTGAKNIFHFIIVIFMLFALVFGIAFSSAKVSSGVKLGSQYRGSFQAVVGVYDSNQKNDDDEGLPNGHAERGATILQNKMSPFSDGSINITIDGLSRLIVTAPRDSFDNNKQLFINAIQSTGGLFILDQDNKDVMLSSLIDGVGLSSELDQKSPTSKLLGNVAAVSRKSGGTNRPFVQFDLDNNYFKDLASGGSGENKKAPKLSLVIDTTTILDTVRNYFLFGSNDDRDANLEVFSEVFLKPIFNKLQDDQNGLSNEQIAVLKDFWTINYWEVTGNGSWQEKTASLADTNFIRSYLGNVEKLRTLFFADGNADHQFDYQNHVTKYFYDSNATGDDFKEGGKYHNNLDIDGFSVNVTTAFNTLTNIILPLVNKQGVINEQLNKNLFEDHFLFSGEVEGAKTFQADNSAEIIGDTLRISTDTNTYAKKAAAQISQTASGFSFHVFSVSSVDPVISNIMFIFSLVVLGIIAVVIAIFLLFFYRLLGFFTIIIAAIIASLTILMNVVFGIAMGPDILAIMFVLIGIVMDLSIVFFEAFKNNIYRDKRPLNSAFKISNRETLGLVIDVSLAALLPNIVLFWIGIGFLKNFATILTMGIFFTLAFGVVVLRVMMYFTAKSGVLKRWTWLLPIDTSLEYRGSFFKNYMIGYYEERLETYHSKTELSTKDLLKIKKLEERLAHFQASNEKTIARRHAKSVVRRQKNAKRWSKKQVYYQNKVDKNLGKTNVLTKPLQYHYNERLENYNYLLSTTDYDWDTPNQVLTERLTKIERTTGRIGWITTLFTLIFGIIALVFAFTIGLNYSPNYGKGTQYYVYGEYVTQTYDNLGAADTIEGINTAPADVREKIIADLDRIAVDSKNQVLFEHNWDIESQPNVPEEYQYEWQALGVYQAYRYMISNNYLKYLTSRVKGIEFKDPQYAYGSDYSMIDPATGTFANRPWVSITVTNNLIPNNDAIKDSFQIFAGRGSGTTKPHPPTNEYGVIGTSLTPHTADAQIRQIGITFGIVLLALLIYMLIRFKWTYYVALALGLVITLILTLSLVVVLRVPFTIEALAGVLGVLEFALITGMLLLGKGKSLIVSKNEGALAHYFEEEIRLQASKKEAKQSYKKALMTLKNTQKEEVATLDKKDPDYKTKLKALKKIQNETYKATKRNQRENYETTIKNLNYALRREAAKNNFLKEIFVEVLKFGILRTIFIGVFYFIIALVLTVTMPPIAIMGFTLMIGVVITTLVMLTIMLPIWVRLEARRIRWKYGYKRFVNKLRVNREEQVVAGLND